jgi:type I restriction enzyme S subunit
MKTISIGEIAEVKMGTAPPGSSYNNDGHGMPMIAGAGDYGLLYPSPKKWTTQPIITAIPGDLIICIRATIGDLNWADKEYCLGRGVAGIRPKDHMIDKSYLAYYLNYKKDDLVKKGTGSTFLAIRRSDLETFSIPYLPLSEQKRIARIMNQADAICRKRRQAIQIANDLVPAIFHEMFGDVTRNSKKFPVARLGDVATLDRGKSRHRPRNAPHLYGGPYPFIQTGDIANSDGRIKAYSQTYSEAGLEQSHLWPKGTLCITIAANIAETAILTFDACFPDSVVGLIPSKVLTVEYVQYWFSVMQQRIEDAATQVAQKNINLQILRELEIPIPSKDIQHEFSNLLMKMRENRDKQLHSENLLEDLFNSLVQRAFRGEL